MSPVSIAPSPVKLAEIFPPDAILMGLEVRNKVNVIEKMVRHAVARGDVLQTAEDGLVSLFHEREKLGTTALGNGIVFPHCESSFTKRFVGVAGFLSSPIPFDAVDGEPVDSVFLVLAPPDRRERFLQILGRLVTFGRDRRLRVLLRGCRTVEHVSCFLQELDQPDLGDPRGAGIDQGPPGRGARLPGSVQGQ